MPHDGTHPVRALLMVSALCGSAMGDAASGEPDDPIEGVRSLAEFDTALRIRVPSPTTAEIEANGAPEDRADRVNMVLMPPDAFGIGDANTDPSTHDHHNAGDPAEPVDLPLLLTGSPDGLVRLSVLPDWDATRSSPQRALERYSAAPPLSESGPFRVGFGRDTTLINGGFTRETSPDEIGDSYFESSGERYEQFNLDLEWTPMARDASVQWLVLSGVHAVRADISRLDSASLGIAQARGLVAMPTIGTGVRWMPSDAVVFSTTAATQTVDSQGGVVDLSFNAEFRLSPKVGLTAGYEYYESTMSVENLRTSLDREGVFAKLTIRF